MRGELSGEAILEILKDDGGVEHRRVATGQLGRLRTWVGCRERRVATAGTKRPSAPLDDARVAELMNAMLTSRSAELRALLALVCEQGYGQARSDEARELVRSGLANDAARFLSEAVERGCVATSLSGRLQKGPLADARYFAIWQACEYAISTYEPLEHDFDEVSLDRVLRARTLATEDIGAGNLFQSVQRYWAQRIAPPDAVPPGSPRESLFLRLIARLERSEVRTRANWREAHFRYEDYLLLEGLRVAVAARVPSPALARLAEEREERTRRRAALLAGVERGWRPVLEALLDDREALAKPLDHPTYHALVGLPRPQLGVAAHNLFRLTSTGTWVDRLALLVVYETSTVGHHFHSVGGAFRAIRLDLETRRFELDDARMAETLAHAPKRSTKLLASVAWTLGRGPAPHTRAALAAAANDLAGNRYHKGWPARIAALLARHPEPVTVGVEAGPGPNAEAATRQAPPEPDREPPHDRPRPTDIFSNLLLAIFGTMPPSRPDPGSKPAPVSRYQLLAGADADLKTPKWGSGDRRAHQFYTSLLALPDRLDPLWTALHIAAYSLDGKAQPGAAWLKQARAIVAEHGADRHEDLLRQVLALVDPPHHATFLGLNTIRALLFLAADRSADAVAPAITEFAQGRCFVTVPRYGIKAERLGNACLWALINLPDGGGVPHLARLLTRVKYPKVRKKIDAALNTAARKAGLSRGALDELSVPAHGLDAAGERRMAVGGGVATLTTTFEGAILAWMSPDGKVLKAPNAAMKADRQALGAVKALAKEINADLAAQIFRLQRLYLEDRGWPAEIWRQRYRNHPLVRPLTEHLIWWADRAGERIAFIPRAGGAEDVAGRPVMIEGADVRLWHPIDAEVSDVFAWRERLGALDVDQPFAQAWREVYRLTDAERTTGAYTNRWAGHILKQHQAMTLARLNGWTVTHRMWVDAPNDKPWHLLLPAHGLVADYWVEGAGGEDPEVLDSQAYLYVTTDRVAFHRMASDAVDSARGPKRGEPVALATVPPVVFSEVMRHADLLTGVASVTSDPQWVDRGRAAAHPNQWRRDAEHYWANAGWATLTASGETRRALLERIIPRLAIADRCTWEKNALVVRGARHHYRIHLGSAAAQIVENSRHLCIVPKTEKGLPVRLPFAGDRVLSIIVSKALLLAGDSNIDDPVILHQL